VNQGSYKKLSTGYSLYPPLKKFKGIDEEKNISLTKLLAQISEQYIDILHISIARKKILSAGLSENNLQKFKEKIIEINLSKDINEIDKKLIIDILQKINETSILYDDLKKSIITEIITSIDIKPDSAKIEKINSTAITTSKEIEEKILEIQILNEKLNIASSNTRKYLYGEEINEAEITNFAAIKSNMLPKIHDIMNLIISYYDNNKVSNTDVIMDDINQLIINYKSIKINEIELYKSNLKQTLDEIFEILDNYMKTKSDQLIIDFVNKCDETQINDYIFLLNEKTNDTQILEFISKFNKIMDSDKGKHIIDKINIYIAKKYQSIINDFMNRREEENNFKNFEIINRYIIIIKELNTKKISEIKSELKKEIIDKILNKLYPSDISVEKKELLDNLNDKENFKKILRSEIMTEKDARMFIHEYNRSMYKKNGMILMSLGLPSNIKLIPNVYFQKEYTERIYNSIFKNLNSQRTSKTALLQSLIDASADTSDTELKMNAKLIYSPDFDLIKKKMTEQKGGNILENIGENIIGLAELKIKFIDMIDKYKIESDKYILVYNDVYSYTRYLILIATNQLFTENYVIYNYLNKGLIELYKRIINNIIHDLKSESNEPHIIYIRKYYNVIIKRLHSFLTKLSLFMTDSTDIIDIRNIDITLESIRNDMILLNYFKPIIESYNEIFQNQITIYARLNDIVGEIDYADKVFVSDHEKYRIEGCGHKILSNIESKSKTEICNPAKTSDINMGGDPMIMWVKNESCDATKEISFDEAIKFTEIFDTNNFPENGDISTYMALETQLAKKKGVCVLTYGYSGTGKTYTLFGSEHKTGILQSTLNNINGLYAVKFRLFEIYGRGLPYDFYWNNDSKSRMDDIYHYIFHYRLQNNQNVLSVDRESEDDLVKIVPKDFLKYIENNLGKEGNDYKIEDTYITIKGMDIRAVFNQFVQFTQLIDKYRKSNGDLVSSNNEIALIKRIRETPNNPESSRSILAYDFKLYVGTEPVDGSINEEDAVKFLIIDLPGREEINQTYIEPYLDNEHIKNILKQDSSNTLRLSDSEHSERNTLSVPDSRIERIRMIITCMALNPMALAVFCGELIINTINNMEEKERKEIYGDGTENNPKIIDEYYVNNGRSVIGLDGRIKLLDPEKLNIFVSLIDNKLTYSEKIMDKKYGFGYSTREQHLGVGAIFVIYRLILKNRFDILEKIYKVIADDEINKIIGTYIDNLNSADLYDLIYGIIYSKFKGEQTSKEINILYSEIFDIKRDNKENMLQFIIKYKEKINTLAIPNDNEKIQKIKSKIKNILNYDFLMTPLEGIYINENIIGLIKYMSSKLIRNTNDTPIDILNKKNNIQEQIFLEDQRNIARCWLMNYNDSDMNKSNAAGKKYIETMKDLLGIRDKFPLSFKLTVGSTKYYDNIYSSIYRVTESIGERIGSGSGSGSGSGKSIDPRIDINTEQLIKQQKYLISTYTSNKIYNFDKPIITDILSPYIETSELPSDHPRNKSAIKDFKMFYLFGNYDDNQKTQFKCEHQIKLLHNTKNFIQAITR
jgi:hypothetical protein